MIYNVYSIRDELTGYMNITLDVNDNTAIRNFKHAVNSKDLLFNTNPKDYTLYKIGTFETDNGILIPLTPIEYIVNGTSIIEE